MSILLALAFAAGIANVALAIGRSLWNYLFGLVVAGLYAVAFFRDGFYREMLLHLLFIAVQVYGFLDWRASIRRDGEVRVHRIRGREQLIWLAATAALFVAWGLALDAFTYTTTPWLEAGLVVLSLAAQVMIARRRVEAWPLWIVVDLLSLGAVFRFELSWTDMRVLIFPAMSVVGWFVWRRAEARASTLRLPAPPAAVAAA